MDSMLITPIKSDIIIPKNVFVKSFYDGIIIPSMKKYLKYLINFFNILCKDCNIIKYEDNQYVYTNFLNMLGRINKGKTIAQLLGNMGEAIIVRRCNENEDINKKWMKVASKNSEFNLDSSKFAAVGTGLYRTRVSNVYSHYYSPCDTQRDIIWAYKDNPNNQFIIPNNINSGFVGGLQVKTSFDGYKYFGKDLIANRYIVPIVYFDLCNDFYSVYSNSILNGYNGRIECDLIDVKQIDIDAYNEMIFYKDYIYALAENKIDVKNFVERGYKTPIGNAIVKMLQTEI